MAHKLGTGSTKNNRDSKAKFLGLKVSPYTYITKGTILVKQRGLEVKPGFNVLIGKDYTLFANISGYCIIKKKLIHII